MKDRAGPARLLVVDDEPDLVDLYEATLAPQYAVRTAYGGPEAVDAIDEGEDFDVALVDRRMPDVTGDDVLSRLEASSPDCRVAMVTAVEPDFDILDMPFDEYLVKPVSRSALLETVERLLRLKNYREQCQEEYALATKVATLRAHKEPEELAENDEYRALVDRLDELRESMDETTERFSSEEFAAAFADIGGPGTQVSRSD